MPTDEPAGLLLLAANMVVLGGAGALLLSRRPGIAIFVLLLAPCIPSAISPNSLEGEAEPGRLGGYARVSLIMLAGGAGSLAWLRSGKRRRGRLPAQYIVLAAFLAWAMASTVRSAAPFYTFVRAATFMGLGGFTLGLHAWCADERGLQRVLDAVFAFVALWVAANVITLLLLPGKAWWWNAPERFQGLKNHPNSMGSFCAMSFPVVLWRYWRCRGAGRVALVALGGALGAMLLMSGSRTSILCGGLGMVACLLAAGRPKSSAALLAAGAVAGIVLLVSPPASFRRRVADDTSVNLTGRPAIWRAGWYMVEERPLEGFGYDAETKVLQDPAYQRTARVRFSVTARQSMHNGFLSILAGTGVVGLALWLALLAVPYGRAWLVRAGGRKGLAVGIMSMGLLANLVESQITPASSLTAAMFWVAWAVAGRLAAGVRAGPASALRTGTGGEVAT
ncbi:MAG: O-antigen ligase family protein [Planctomycetota bacterium]|jgi:hypothetical protein